MKFFIETAREQHLVKDEASLRAKHAKKIADLHARGSRVQVHESADLQEPRIERGIWLFDCDCGAGVAADPTFSVACCFGCGAIHTNLVFPPDYSDIERALLARRKPENRNWLPTETLEQVLADNAAHGVKP